MVFIRFRAAHTPDLMDQGITGSERSIQLSGCHTDFSNCEFSTIILQIISMSFGGTDSPITSAIFARLTSSPLDLCTVLVTKHIP
jgi:hypothetical protein